MSPLDPDHAKSIGTARPKGLNGNGNAEARPDATARRSQEKLAPPVERIPSRLRGPEDHKLWTLENAILTLHIAIQDADNVSDRMFDLLVANARRFAKSEDLENVVDKSMWF